MTAETTNQATPIPGDIPIAEIVRPEREEQVAEILRNATADGQAVLPFGGATALVTGNAVSDPLLGLDLRGLRGVREYQPTDLTASFWAGTPIQEVAAVLGEHGQELPLDLPQLERATLGGLVATGFSGPRRLGSGTLKDLLIGAGYVRGDGLVAKAGGMLVKNVSGFEIPRLLHGSWGALAVITSVNLKVVPRPKADLTISQRFGDPGAGLAAQVRLLAAHQTIAASVVEREGDGWMLHVRMLGREASLRALLAEIRDELGKDAAVTEGDSVWQAHVERWSIPDDALQIVIGGQPRTMTDVATAIAAWPGVQEMTVSTGTSSLRARVDSASVASDELHGRLAEVAAASPLAWVIEAAPAAWKGAGSVWGPEPGGLDVMRSVKREFDPAGILNRGRLFVEQR